MPDTPRVPVPSTPLPADVAARIRATAPQVTPPVVPEVALRLIHLPRRPDGA